MNNPLKQSCIRPFQTRERPDKSPEHLPRFNFIKHPVPELGQECSLEGNNVIPLQPRQISFMEDLLGDG